MRAVSSAICTSGEPVSLSLSPKASRTLAIVSSFGGSTVVISSSGYRTLPLTPRMANAGAVGNESYDEFADPSTVVDLVRLAAMASEAVTTPLPIGTNTNHQRGLTPFPTKGSDPFVTDLLKLQGFLEVADYE